MSTGNGQSEESKIENRKSKITLFFAAGEASGDTHGANLIRALREAEPDLVCEGLGGSRMAAAGMHLRHDLASQAIMGFGEVLRSFRSIRRVFLETVAYLKRNRPDCLVVIDYPGFNIRLARKANALGIPVVYYISPQVWAWKKKRIQTIAAVVRKMLVILAFEQELYRDAGVDCTYVGHPLLDHIAAIEIAGTYRNGCVIGLLPGSREQEVGRLLSIMIDVARRVRDARPDARFIAPCVDAARERQVRGIARGFPLETVVGKPYEVLDAARFCLVASGTATLETALFGAPMAILYKTSAANYWIARRLVNVEHIGLVNILAGRGIVPEFVQADACVEKVLPVALELIGDTPARERMLRDLEELRAKLGSSGASARAAAEILDIVEREDTCRNGCF